MKCLAINTATKQLSIALVDGGKVLSTFETSEMRNQGNVLLGYIEKALSQGDLSFEDLDLLVVGTGPGSFTGIRIGIATMRGLAMAAKKPLRGFSSFEIFAECRPGMVNVIAVESWRDELYFAVLDEKGIELMEPMNETPEVFMKRFHQVCPDIKNIIISGDAKETMKPFFEGALLTERDANAATIAKRALINFKEGDVFEKPLPYYLREADVTLSKKKVKRIKES